MEPMQTKPKREKPSISKYARLAEKSDGAFKRLTGVQRATFRVRAELLSAADAAKKARGGRGSFLRIEDRLLMALE